MEHIHRSCLQPKCTPPSSISSHHHWQPMSQNQACQSKGVPTAGSCACSAGTHPSWRSCSVASSVVFLCIKKRDRRLAKNWPDKYRLAIRKAPCAVNCRPKTNLFSAGVGGVFPKSDFELCCLFPALLAGRIWNAKWHVSPLCFDEEPRAAPSCTTTQPRPTTTCAENRG